MKLHLGCGKRYIPGFLHIDLANFPHIDYRRNVGDLSIFPANHVDLIYASHVLEYFDRQEAVGVLKEWFRVLKPGGTLRLAVPDFEALIKVYEMDRDLHKILGPLYGRLIVSGESNTIFYHKTVYDFDSLKTLLESVGFTDVHRYDWRETIHRDYDDHSQAYIPHMDKEHGLLISLNVEAVKATAPCPPPSEIPHENCQSFLPRVSGTI